MSDGIVFSIGHSGHTIEHFLDLLRRHAIQVVADVRSSPYSSYAPQFNRPVLESSIRQSGLKYVFLGRELGGRPEGDEYYDRAGHVRYDLLAGSPLFLGGVERLREGIRHYRVGVLCSEENPAICHRALLIGRVLAEQGIRIQHVRGDGRVETDDQVPGLADAKEPAQPTLLDEAPARPWRSPHPVPRRIGGGARLVEREVG